MAKNIQAVMLPRLCFVTPILALLLLACALPGFGSETPAAVNADAPTVSLSSPTADEPLIAAQEIKVLSTAIDPAAGIARVELRVGGQVIWSDANPNPQPNTPYIVAQPWTPPAPGRYALQVRAYNSSGHFGESERRVVQVLDSTPAATQQPPADSLTTPAVITGNNTGDSISASPTPSPPAATPTPVPSPTSSPPPRAFAPTGLEPEGRFREIWLRLGGGESRLGYPLDPALEGRDFARQYFEQGLMYWWDSPAETDYIWALIAESPTLERGESWSRHVDAWPGTDPYRCDEARRHGEMGPLRGFGQVWCDQEEVRNRLGAPRELERGSGGTAPFGQVQFYQGGLMLDDPINAEVYVLFERGDWLRFGY